MEVYLHQEEIVAAVKRAIDRGEPGVLFIDSLPSVRDHTITLDPSEYHELGVPLGDGTYHDAETPLGRIE